MSTRTLISESDVWDVCDQLLAQGILPTAERIIEPLASTVSQVGALVDAWYAKLGERLKQSSCMSGGLPPLPAAAVGAASVLWDAARIHTESVLQACHAREINALERQLAWQQQVAEVATAQTRMAERRLAALELRIQQLATSQSSQSTPHNVASGRRSRGH
ncbi:DNA-binding protein [Roseateles sp. MS654]|uniref:DNA-binding protein n=1 Tax=Roseateles sp. MS654 TaxID=3412685 RepID=UPI003C2C8884